MRRDVDAGWYVATLLLALAAGCLGDACQELSTCYDCVANRSCQFQVIHNGGRYSECVQRVQENQQQNYNITTIIFAADACSSDNLETKEEPLDSSSSTAMTTEKPNNSTEKAGRLDISPANMHCEVPSFDYWAFLGGLCLGISGATVWHLCYQFYRSRKKAAYNEPFSFDSFVNP